MRLRQAGYELVAPFGQPHNGSSNVRVPTTEGAERIELTLRDGFGLVASDLHLWPEEETMMLRALKWALCEFKPKFFVLNGDVMDFPAISQHQRVNWEHRPEVSEEIEWAQHVTSELALCAPRGCRKIWTLGNHDARFSKRLAEHTPEFAKVHGFQLKDHFPLYEPAWSTYVNPELGHESTLIKHRYRGGVHAVWNNLHYTGNHIVTGHLHSALVSALTYYNYRTIWGCDTGCMAEPNARAFNYAENSPRNWRSGFAVLRWENGRMLQPQLVLKHDEKRVQLGTELVTP